MTEGVRILLVEDNSADVYLFRKALKSAGLEFELTVIEDSGSAFAFIRGEGECAGSPIPDRAIIDLSLPKNDGVQIVTLFRQAKRFTDVPIVVAQFIRQAARQRQPGRFAGCPLYSETTRPGGVSSDRLRREGNFAGTPGPPSRTDESVTAVLVLQIHALIRFDETKHSLRLGVFSCIKSIALPR